MSLARSLCLLSLLLLASASLCADPTSATGDEAFLQSTGQRTDDASLLDFFRKRTLSGADLAKLEGAVRSLGSANYAARQRAMQALLDAGQLPFPFCGLHFTIPIPKSAVARNVACA
jgi:hypothetical protein